ncbi:GtrA family protein [Microbacterium sp. NPDC006705]|uniref:GtrA family protein n=1 Tax=Microbacterium sp. NPDC006705 TaxID=3364181 RepID=UPI00384B8E90
MKRLMIQTAQYFWVALVGLVVDFGTLVVLTEFFGVNPLLSAAAGFLLGLVVNFVLSERFVFRDPKLGSRWVRFGLFAVIGLVGLGILTFLMWLQVDVLGWNYIVAKVAATVFVYAWNFIARRAMYHS